MSSGFNSDPYWAIFFKIIETDVKNFHDVDGIMNKVNEISKIHGKIIGDYITYVSKLSEEQYDDLINLRTKEVLKIWQSLRDEIIKKSDTELTIEEISAITIIPEFPQIISDILEKYLNDLQLDETHFKRLFILEFVARMELFLVLITMLINDPMNRIETILKRRFETDRNWSVATSILSLHENLVKKNY